MHCKTVAEQIETPMKKVATFTAEEFKLWKSVGAGPYADRLWRQAAERAAFDFTSMAAELDQPKPEHPRKLHDDIHFTDWQKACRTVMTPKWMPY